MIKIAPLTKSHVLLITLYSLIFPVTNLIGGISSSIGLWLSAPFVLLAWMGGVVFAWIAGTEKAYLIGVFICIWVLGSRMLQRLITK